MVLAHFPGRNQLMYKIIGADGREYGPITADQLRNWIAEGRATAETRVQAEGAAQWKLLTEYLEFAPALARVLPSRPAPGLIYRSPTPRTNSMALAAMLMGILSMTCGVCCCCCCYGLPFNVLGVIFALIALSQIKNDPQSQQGRSLAIVALVLGLALNAPEIVHKMQRL